MLRIGIDIGSTTAKIVVLGADDSVLFEAYERHNAKAKELLLSFLDRLRAQFGDSEVSLNITGSVGMGVSEKCGVAFLPAGTLDDRHWG